MGTASDDFMREVAQKNREKRAKQEERIRRYCDGTRTAQDVANLVGMKIDAVRAAAKKMGLAFRKAAQREL